MMMFIQDFILFVNNQMLKPQLVDYSVVLSFLASFVN